MTNDIIIESKLPKREMTLKPKSQGDIFKHTFKWVIFRLRLEQWKLTYFVKNFIICFLGKIYGCTILCHTI